MEFPDDFRPPEGVEVSDFHTVVNWFYNGTLFVYAKPDVQHSIKDAKQQVVYLANVSGNKGGSIFIDIRTAPPISIYARNYYSSDEARENITGICLMINSPVAKVIGNFYFAFISKKVKTKMVNKVSFGLDWLETL